MDTLVIVCQVVIALGIANVWILRFGKATEWRGGAAQNMKEEFQAYGLPEWFMKVVGFLKLLFAAGLVAAIWLPDLTRPAAVGMAVLMLGAVSMHVKVKDPPKRALPATIMLLLSAFVAVAA